jgi:hypothetical protein
MIFIRLGTQAKLIIYTLTILSHGGINGGIQWGHDAVLSLVLT